MRYASSRDEAEDMLQDGFVKVFQRFDSFKEDGPLGAWVRRVILNTALQHIRDNKNLKMHIELEKAQVVSNDFDEILSGIALDELRQKIQQLPDGCRGVFNLYAIEGYKHREIAEHLDISVGTSKSQYNRARMILQTMIKTEQEVSGQAI